MRIVAGRHRGRPLDTPAGGAIRPTADRVRQALFDRLVHGGLGPEGGDPVAGATVLDAFCGTGALGLEALSRGAAQALFLDISPEALELVRRHVARLGEGGRSRVLRCDATKPGRAPGAANLVFLDPPYGKDLALPALAALDAGGWLAPRAVVVIETDRRDPLPLPAGFAHADQRDYGDTRIRVLLRG